MIPKELGWYSRPTQLSSSTTPIIVLRFFNQMNLFLVLLNTLEFMRRDGRNAARVIVIVTFALYVFVTGV